MPSLVSTKKKNQCMLHYLTIYYYLLLVTHTLVLPPAPQVSYRNTAVNTNTTLNWLEIDFMSNSLPACIVFWCAWRAHHIYVYMILDVTLAVFAHVYLRFFFSLSGFSLLRCSIWMTAIKAAVAAAAFEPNSWAFGIHNSVASSLYTSTYMYI